MLRTVLLASFSNLLVTPLLENTAATCVTYQSHLQDLWPSMADHTIGQWLDERVDFQQKAAYLAEKTAEIYLRSHLDASAMEQLGAFCRRQSSQLFYREFFHRYASVFGSRDAPVFFTCRNPSACAVALIRTLDGVEDARDVPMTFSYRNA